MKTLLNGGIKIRECYILSFRLIIGLCGIFLVAMLWYTSNYNSLPYLRAERTVFKRDLSRIAQITGIIFNTYNITEQNLVSSIFDNYHPVTRNNTLSSKAVSLEKIELASNNGTKAPNGTKTINGTKTANNITDIGTKTTMKNETNGGMKNLNQNSNIKTNPKTKDAKSKPRTTTKNETKNVDIPRPDDKPRRLYLEHGTGRFGNKLFHVAAAISIAKANNMTVYLPYDTEVIRIFNLTQFKTYTAKDYDNFTKSGAKMQKIHHISYKKEFMNLKWKYHVKLYKGGVQTYLYFWKNYQPLIRSLYVFNNFIKYQINAFMDGLQKKYNKLGNTTYVGIHCRRGDRAYDPNVMKAGYQATPVTYFQKAINFTLTRYKTPIIYVVATDDREWTTKYLKPPGENTFIEHTPWGLTAEYDMGILSSMNHTIMSTGSFGWWSSYLAGGDVIYFNKPFKPKTTRGHSWKVYFQTQMYPKDKNWIGMGE